MRKTLTGGSTKMYSIQELVEVCKVPLQGIEKAMDKTGGYHPEDARLTDGLKRSVAKDVMESIRYIPISEFLGRSGALTTAGIAGSNYLIPVKLYDSLVVVAKQYEIAPKVSSQIINGWAGGTLDIPVAVDRSLRAPRGAGGAKAVDTTPQMVKSTLDPVLISANFRMDNSLIEDNQFGLLDWCVKQAGKSISYQENDLVLAALINAPDGDGTLNSGTTGDADQTMMVDGTTTDVISAIRGVGYDEFIPDTLVCTSEAWGHSIGAHAVPTGWDNNVRDRVYDARLGSLDVLFNNSGLLHAATDADGAAFTNCISLVFDRSNAVVTGRKRWMQIENYADPLSDISGAVVTSRSDCVSIYKDSIFVITET